MAGLPKTHISEYPLALKVKLEGLKVTQNYVQFTLLRFWVTESWNGSL